MKSPEERSKERLLHIRAAIKKIEDYTAGYSESQFCTESITNEAVLFQLSIIGEAISHVEKNILSKYDYPWSQVKSFRNVIVHEYFGIRLDKVWSILTEDLTELETVVDKILKQEFSI